MLEKKKKRLSAAEDDPDASLDPEIEDLDDFLQEAEVLTQGVAETVEEAVEGEAESVGAERGAQARWIAQGLQQPVENLERLEAGPEAGEDAGTLFYTLTISGIRLAIRRDGLRAYLTAVSAKKTSEETVGEVLQSCHLVGIKTAGLQPFLKRKGKQRKWLKIADGRPPVPGHPDRIDFFCPGKPEQPLSAEAFSLMSLGVTELFGTSRIDEATLQKCQGLAVVPGEILARGIPEEGGEPGLDVFGRTLSPSLETPQERVKPGLRVSLSEEGGYRAEALGYMCLLEGQLSVLSPLWIDPEQVKVYWLLLDDQPHPMTREMVHLCLEELEVKEGIKEDKIEQFVQQVQQGAHKRGMFLVAEGTPPENGEDARVEILVDLGRRVGKEREDGSIDFRDVNFTPSVRQEQRIAQRIPPVPGTAGKDVTGRLLPAQEGEDHPLQAGAHVRMGVEDGVECFYSEIEGGLQVSKSGEELSVIELLQINGDVSFSTGNLNFGGEVVVKGSVVQGFSVKAEGDITVTDTVEPGATVISQQNITVGKGIVGRRTKVMARGGVCAQFVQEATVMAGQDIELGNFAYHANLRAGGKLTIAKGKGRNGGSLMGGQVWAKQGLEAHLAGTKAHTPTQLVAGLELEQAQKLDKLNASIDTSFQHIGKILRRFNLEQVDVSQIRHMIAAATGPRQKILAQAARNLGQVTQIHQKLMAARNALQEELGDIQKEAEIQVHGTVFPGVEIRLGEHRLKMVDEIKGPRFHVVEDKLVTA